MKISDRIELFQELQFKKILEDYIKATTVVADQNIAFSKLGILANPSVLYEISFSLANLVPNTTDYICALAPSGIPLGVSVSQQLKKPLIFYNPQGWERQGSSKNILPEPPTQKHYTLIDAHYRTGRSSFWCEGYISSRFNGVTSAICTPVVFDTCNVISSNTKIRAFANAEVASGTMYRLYGLSENMIATQIKNLESHFWSYPPSLDFDLNEYRASNPTAKWIEYAKGARGNIFRKYPDIKIIPETKDLIDPYLKGSNMSIGEFAWHLFTIPQLLQEICKIAGAKLNIEEFDYLLGVGHLGMSLAIALGYYNRDRFQGQILTWLGEYGLLPSSSDLDKKRILFITTRVQFGTYLMDALLDVEKHNGKVLEVVTVFRDFNANNFLERLRQTSLSRLRQKEIHITCLS